MSIEEHLRVITRIRPRLSKAELKKEPSVFKISDTSVQIIDSVNKAQSFTSNAAFDGDADNEQFFNECGVSKLIESALSGFRYLATFCSAEFYKTVVDVVVNSHFFLIPHCHIVPRYSPTVRRDQERPIQCLMETYQA